MIDDMRTKIHIIADTIYEEFVVPIHIRPRNGWRELNFLQ